MAEPVMACLGKRAPMMHVVFVPSKQGIFNSAPWKEAFLDMEHQSSRVSSYMLKLEAGLSS